MESILIYEGLAYVSFDDQTSPSSVDLTEVSILQIGSLYEIRCQRQRPSKRVTVTPISLPTLQGHIVEQPNPSVTRFVTRPH